MTLKLEGDLNNLKMYFHTENEAASLRHSKLELERIQKYHVSRSKVNVKMSKATNYFERYRSRYSDQAPAVSNQQFLSCTLQLLHCRDFDLGPMTLKLICDLGILKMYHHTKNEIAR